jgi:putative glutathione S-transferase
MGAYVAAGGEFERDTDYITTRITAGGRDGYPVEPGRYRLIVARACPWANRAIIVRRLLGLEPVLSIGFCGPTHDKRSWTFDLDPGGVDPVLKIPRLADAYFARFPDYPKGITVPAIVDVPTGQVVTNDFAQMTLDLSTEWRQYHREGAPELYPERLRAEIDEVAKRVYTEINNGVYRCGFAGSQKAYDKAYERLFAALDWVSERLSGQRYLVGDTITEADVRLFTTLARFDPVYHGHFKCNRQKLDEMPVLWASATPSISSRSSSTTTSSTPTSIRRGSCRKVPTYRTGWWRMGESPWAASHSETERRHLRRLRLSGCRPGTRRCPKTTPCAPTIRRAASGTGRPARP